MIERRTIIRAPQDVVNIIIEKPGMPPPCVYEDTDYEPVSPPRINHNVVCVQPSANACPQGSYADQSNISGGSSLCPGQQQQSLINPMNQIIGNQTIPISQQYVVPSQTQQFVPRSNWPSTQYLPQQVTGGSMFLPQQQQTQSSMFSRRSQYVPQIQTYNVVPNMQQQFMPIQQQSQMGQMGLQYPSISQQYLPGSYQYYPSSSQYLRGGMSSYNQQSFIPSSSRLLPQQQTSYLSQSGKKSVFNPVQQQQQPQQTSSQYTQVSPQLSPVQSPVQQQQTTGSSYFWPKTQKIHQQQNIPPVI